MEYLVAFKTEVLFTVFDWQNKLLITKWLVSLIEVFALEGSAVVIHIKSNGLISYVGDSFG